MRPSLPSVNGRFFAAFRRSGAEKDEALFTMIVVNIGYTAEFKGKYSQLALT